VIFVWRVTSCMAHDPADRSSKEAARDWAWNTSKRCRSRVWKTAAGMTGG
jgi:hypothetical protein